LEKLYDIQYISIYISRAIGPLILKWKCYESQ
jgi:hypothetical protein